MQIPFFSYCYFVVEGMNLAFSGVKITRKNSKAQGGLPSFSLIVVGVIPLFYGPFPTI